MDYILYHKNEVTIGRKSEPMYDYAKLYKEKFEAFKTQEVKLKEQKLKYVLRKFIEDLYENKKNKKD